jgi:diguanylate cyclase
MAITKPPPKAGAAAATSAATAGASPLSSDTPAQLAKAALRRLALDKLEPTPDNYARAYQLEQGGPPPASLPERAQRTLERLVARGFEGDAATAILSALLDGDWERAERAISEPQAGGDALATLIERLVRSVERGGKQWTTARKKDSLQRVLAGSRGDSVRLQQRLRQLVTNWEADTLGAGDEPAAAAAAAGEVVAVTPTPTSVPASASPAAARAEPSAEQPAGSAVREDTPPSGPQPSERAVVVLGNTVVRAMPSQDAISRSLADAIAQAAQRFRQDDATQDQAKEIEVLCDRADWVLQHREHLFEQISGLCLELTSSLTELAEDASWAQGQCDAMRLTVEEGLTARGVKSVSELLRTTRNRQAELRLERDSARDALKLMINRMLSELGELGSQTGRFHESVGRYADVIESADTLESLAGVVREMVEESRTVQLLVSQTQHRLEEEHARASELSNRVGELEGELRRLSSEVSTDQLTQIANRRGLLQAFDVECARLQRAEGDEPDENKPAGLSIGLLDIDNFKRLNDELGHSAGDEALKALAATVSKTLRPTDMVARYGGEEFVVLLPDTPVDEAQQILTRLQRSLTGGLFMHENKQIFVTFSAGVTAYCPGERIEDALQRADMALYQAKRAGKNRTLIG